MRTLISIMTCHAHADRNAAIRETWLPLVKKFNDNVDVLFMRGGDTAFRADDVVQFACADSYLAVSAKFRHIVQHTLSAGYDLLIQVDNDTFFMPLPEFITEFKSHECMGFVRHGDFYTSGNNRCEYPHGSCFSLSRLAMRAFLAFEGRIPWAHDMAVGQALHAAGIPLFHSDRIKTAEGLGWPQDNNDIISSHWIKPVRMRDIMRYNAQRLA